MIRGIIRMLEGACLGLGAGAAYGLTLGYLIAPTVRPGQPLQHEWYTLAVVAYAFLASLGGAVIGAFLAFAPGYRALGTTLAGLILGSVIGYFVWRSSPTPPDLAYQGWTIVWFALGGTFVGAVMGATWLQQDRNPPAGA